MAQIDVSESEKSTKDGSEKILEEARARFKLAEESEKKNRDLALEDIRFRAGEHWPEDIKNLRANDKRPCLVINKIPSFIQQITNDQRQNRPSIKVHPVDDNGDEETAKIIQGLIRHIEYNSNADVAYDTGFESAVTGGRGYWRVVTAYVDPMSFDQELLIKRIRNPLSVFFDPASKEPDGSDANWAFVVENLSRDEFRALYPDAELSKGSEWESIGNDAPGWVETDGVRVAEYLYRVFERRKIALLSTGDTVLFDDLPEALPEGVEIVKTRIANVPVIKWCKINGCEILEETEWLGKWIPIIPVLGAEVDINGELILEGVVRNAKDPARMYDYWASAETEAIALAPRTPFIMAEGQDEGFEEQWATANTRNHSTLKYRPVSIGGQLMPPPQRNSFEPAVQAITQARMLASDDMKSTTGIYDAALGAKSNETSGIAIQRRNVQAQTSNFHFTDNLTRSIRHTGRVLIDLIPKIYDTARAARIIGEDGEQRIVKVNEPFKENGKEVLYELSAGKYDVTVDVGPSFATKRQEAAASMLELSKAVPQLIQIAGDLMVKNMDWPGAPEIAERLKKTLPPGLSDDPKQNAQDVPPQVQAQMQQMGQLVDQLTAKLNELQTEKEQKLIEIESRERIEMAKVQSNIEIEMAKLGSQEAIELLRQEVAQIEQRLALLNYDQPIETESESFPEEEREPMMAAEPEGIPTGGASPGTPMENSP